MASTISGYGLYFEKMQFNDKTALEDGGRFYLTHDAPEQYKANLFRYWSQYDHLDPEACWALLRKLVQAELDRLPNNMFVRVGGWLAGLCEVPDHLRSEYERLVAAASAPPPPPPPPLPPAGDATDKQRNVIRRCRDRGQWFDVFDGAGGYGMNGPTDEQIHAMSKSEASRLIASILAGPG